MTIISMKNYFIEVNQLKNGRIFKKKYLTCVCGSDKNIHPSGTHPWAETCHALLPPNV
jgi:hypothetical protein